MPHFYLMDPDAMSQKDAALLRSRLHVSSARTLFDHKKVNHGIATLYDAVEYALKWYYLANLSTDLDIHDNLELYKAVKKIVNIEFDFKSLHDLMETSLDGDVEVEVEDLWGDVTGFLRDIGVIPFELDILPENHEKTREILGI